MFTLRIIMYKSGHGCSRDGVCWREIRSLLVVDSFVRHVLVGGRTNSIWRSGENNSIF